MTRISKPSQKANAFRLLIAALVALVALPSIAVAQAQSEIAEVENAGSGLIFYPFVSYQALILTVTGPCDYTFRKVFEGGDPYWKLDQTTIDGMYTYQLQVRPKIEGSIIETLIQARKEGDEETPKQLCRDGKLPGDPLIQAEGFMVDRGEIVFDPGSSDEKMSRFDVDVEGDVLGGGGVLSGGGLGGSDPAAKDFVINDDLIVDGSACIGFDCVNGESFSFDTIRLKENNLRIKFDDTSVAASFPRTDWQLTANASANGGASKFSIDDISGSRTPFTVEANARSHSLYVDDGGRIGNRTSTPSTEIHTIDGDTPTLRLQQDGSSGFTPQTWDVAGNETNFFIRDVTNGSTLPFRIRPGAPTSSIFIDVDGDVGIGTASPGTTTSGDEARMEILTTDADHGGLLVENASGTTDGRVMLELNNNGAVRVDLRGDQDWRFGTSGAGFRIIDLSDAGTVEFQLATNGDMEITGNLVTGGGGTCDPGPCDGVFIDYELESIEEHAAYMWENKHLWGVGPTPEGEPINVSKKVTGVLHELEKAHIYIEQLNDRLKDRDAQVDELTERLARLEALLQGQTAQD